MNIKNEAVRFLIPITSSMLFACATLSGTPSDTLIASADYGPAPISPGAAIRDYFKDKLYDPFSAQYEISAPKKGWRSSTLTSPIFGWRVVAKVNAKNRFGGYVGQHIYMFIFRGEAIVDMQDEDLAHTIYDASGDGPGDENTPRKDAGEKPALSEYDADFRRMLSPGK